MIMGGFRNKTKSLWVSLQPQWVFVPKVMEFLLEHFRAILIGNINKWTENDVGNVWAQNQFILGWFAS